MSVFYRTHLYHINNNKKTIINISNAAQLSKQLIKRANNINIIIIRRLFRPLLWRPCCFYAIFCWDHLFVKNYDLLFDFLICFLKCVSFCCIVLLRIMIWWFFFSFVFLVISFWILQSSVKYYGLIFNFIAFVFRREY